MQSPGQLIPGPVTVPAPAPWVWTVSVRWVGDAPERHLVEEAVDRGRGRGLVVDVPVDDPVVQRGRAVVGVGAGRHRDVCHDRVGGRDRREVERPQERTGHAELVDRVGPPVDGEERVAARVEPQALAVAGAVAGEVEVGDDVVSVAEGAVDGIDVVDLDPGAVADEQVTGCGVVLDILGIAAAERRGAEPRDDVVGGAVDAVGPRPHDRDPVPVVVRDVERAVTRVESDARGLLARLRQVPASQQGAAAEPRARACRREQVGALVEPRLVDLGVGDQQPVLRRHVDDARGVGARRGVPRRCRSFGRAWGCTTSAAEAGDAGQSSAPQHRQQERAREAHAARRCLPREAAKPRRSPPHEPSIGFRVPPAPRRLPSTGRPYRLRPWSEWRVSA